MLKTTGFLLAARFSLAAQQAPNTPLHIDRFTTEQGLAVNAVSGVVQDRAGFIWVGTRRGLQRFDGREFVGIASLAPHAPNALSQRIISVTMDHAGRLWVVTPGTLFRVDAGTRATAQLPAENGMAEMAFDSSDHAWFVNTGTVKRIDAAGDSLTLRITDRTFAGRRTNGITVSQSGAVWIAVAGAGQATIARLDPHGGTAASYHIPAVTPIQLFEDALGRIWLRGTESIGVLTPATGAYQRVEQVSGLRTERITSDGAAGFFILSENWLAHLDQNGRLTQWSNSPLVFGRGLLPTAAMRDREGAVWLTTLTGGLLRLAREPTTFRSYARESAPLLRLASDFITALHEDSSGALWVGTLRGGLYRIAGDWSTSEVFRSDAPSSHSLPSDDIWDIEEDKDGNVWVLTATHLCRRLVRGFRCHALPDFVSDAARDTSGYFWLASYEHGTITSFDPRTERFGTSYTLPGISRPITLFAEPRSDELWIGANGIVRVRVRSGNVLGPPTQIGAANASDPIANFHFFRDHDGKLWLGSDYGLQLWNERLGKFEAVSPALGGTTVYSIAEDRAGRLWLGTTHGLVHYAPRTGSSRKYTRRDGFLSGELNRRAAIQRRNGDMLFGGVQGLTQFDPDVIAGVRSNAPVVLTRWRKFNSNGVVEAAIDGVDSLRLEPDDRAFAVEFAALTFGPSVGRRFRYQLGELGPQWIESVEPIATFPKPRPGRYTFRVQTASGADARWSDPGAIVVLNVIPPFYATLWFRVLIATAFIGMVWTAHRLRLRHALASEQLRLRVSRDLHDDIGAGLSSIALISDAVGSDLRAADPDRALGQLRKIGEVARGLVADLRDIVWAIDPDRDRLDDIATRMQDAAASLLPDVSVTFRLPDRDKLAARVGMAGRRDLLLLYKEILHNIAKHAAATSVVIELVAQPDALDLVISDNGRGFEADHKENGVGTGLKSVRERADRLGARLDLHSQPGGGTTVRVRLHTT